MSHPQQPEHAAAGATGSPPLAVSADPEDAPAPGPPRSDAVLGGRYRVDERIGAGGMATIYRGVDLTLERPVAVKVLHSHLADDPELLARFRTEARHAAALSHPHIVAVYDQGVADLPYIVMELVDGPSLRQILSDRGPLSDREALAVIGPVARALAKAHRSGVVHRDIKPENVLVAADGTPKVADFGIARVIAGTSHTQTGALIGSVHYMAPEIVDGQEASAASDQYAVGVLLYELLTGQRPFAGDSPMAVALRHTRDRVPAPSQEGARCGPEVDAVVARATDHVPSARYPDLAALADALRGAVPGGASEVEVSDADSGRTLVIPARAQDTLVVTGQAAETAVVAASTPTVAEPPQQGPQPSSSMPAQAGRGQDGGEAGAEAGPRRRRGRRLLVAALLTVVLLAGAAGGAYAWWHYLVAPITPVPELTGLSEAEAFDDTTDLGLGFTVSDHRYDFDAPEGEVLAQEPAPDTEVRRGDDVSVVLSRGPEPVEVPSVVGESEDDAVGAIEAERLGVSVESQHHDEVPEGEVISQEPSAGETVLQGDDASLVVSLGIEQVVVPGLVGGDASAVDDALSEAKLELADVDRVWSDDAPEEGEVIDQTVAAGEEVDKGSSVSVTVSRGPLTIQTPDVRGDAVEDARAEIEALSLDVDVVVEPRQRLGPFVRGSVGMVEEQLPEPGEAIQRGETVTLYTFSD